MCRLFDPLAKLAGLGAYAHMDIGSDGQRAIRLTYARMVRANEARKAQTIRARYERLLLLQLDVAPGDRPRTVQQLVASGKIRVVGGKYKLIK